MKAVPIKLNSLRKGSVNYYVGIDGIFPSNADAVNAATVLIKRLLQIKAYCARYSKPVVVLINSSRVPRYIHTALRGLNLQFISIVERDADAKYGDYIQVEDPLSFIAKNAEVVILLKTRTEDEDVDFGDLETPSVVLFYEVEKDTAPIVTNPNEVVKNFQLPKADNGAPYAAFYHEPLFRRVPYTYWQDLMDTMPDTNQMTGRGIPNNVW